MGEFISDTSLCDFVLVGIGHKFADRSLLHNHAQAASYDHDKRTKQRQRQKTLTTITTRRVLLLQVTYGLMAAHAAGNAKALPLIRGQITWFNYNEFLPEVFNTSQFVLFLVAIVYL